jgi:outer membrane lipopolysaccharide assembly protein LptE/RlpB
MRKYKSLSWITCLLLFVVGCGYTFRGSGSVLPPDVRKIHIPLVQNDSTKIGLGTLLTEALRDEVDSYGVVVVVDTEAEADAILTVEVLDVQESAGSVRSGTNTALQMDTVVFIRGELRRESGELLWRDPQLKVQQTYGADSSTVVTSSVGFAGGSISSSDLGGLSSREISRGQEADVLASLVEEASREIYDKAVAPDF